MNLLLKTTLISIILTNLIFGQSAKKIFMQADFNKMIERYGKQQVEIQLPKKQILDSLKKRPYVWTEGYRIQLFASNNIQSARQMKKKLHTQIEDSIYIVKDEALYRIQFGDYTNRIIAETKVDSMRKYGWPRAWIVTRKVKEFVKKETKIKTPQPKNEMDNLSEYYAVQVAAYSTKESAKAVQIELLNRFSVVNICNINGLYKVLVGEIPHRNAAESLLDEVKNAGYNDAWITFVSE